jgi:uncharacterized protein YndB with AHSA1/START domain
MAFAFSVSDIVPTGPQQIYNAWLNDEGHANITGGQPAHISAQEGADFTVWNGYITGRNLKLEPGRRIVQSWRTTKFTAADPDSQIEVLLEPVPDGSHGQPHQRARRAHELPRWRMAEQLLRADETAFRGLRLTESAAAFELVPHPLPKLRFALASNFRP